MNQVTVVDHPLVQHKLTTCRMKETETWQFRGLVEDITTLLLYEACRQAQTEGVEINTPVAKAEGRVLKTDSPCFVAVLRAGLGMVPGGLRLFPSARAGHIGLYRDHETHAPVEYYCNLPRGIEACDCYLLEPMLATGGSAVRALDILKKANAGSITVLSLIAAPEGVKMITARHKDVQIFLGALDEKLNDKAYIIPGLGDAGDRIFGTV